MISTVWAPEPLPCRAVGFSSDSLLPNFNLEIVAWAPSSPCSGLSGKIARSGGPAWFCGRFSFFTGLLPWIYNGPSQYGHIPGAVSIFLLLLLTALPGALFFRFRLRPALGPGKMEIPRPSWLRPVGFAGIPPRLPLLRIPLGAFGVLAVPHPSSGPDGRHHRSVWRILPDRPGQRGGLPAPRSLYRPELEAGTKRVLAAVVLVALSAA